MKKFLVLFFSIFICSIAHADTETINWYVDETSYATTTCQTGGDIILPNTPYKYGYTFQGWASYTLIEYLESTGTQWIDTGVIANKNSGFYLDLNITYKTSNNYVTVFGVSTMSSNIYGIAINTYMAGCELYLKEGVGTNLNIPSGSRAQISYIDGVLIDALGNISYLITADVNYIYSFTIFRYYPNNAPFAKNMKLYNAKIYDKKTIVRDFIPVLDHNNTPCLYDKVTNQFFYNQGTGDFIAGPVINQ